MIIAFTGLRKEGTGKILDTLSWKFEDSQVVFDFAFDSLESVEGWRLYQMDELQPVAYESVIWVQTVNNILLESFVN
jgi:hypothetical protein